MHIPGNPPGRQFEAARKRIDTPAARRDHRDRNLCRGAERMAVAHYHGSCQCGAIAFEADLDLDDPITCNCSRCRRLGSVLVFAPATAFHQTRGEGAMSSYHFNRGVIDHLFCPVCGVESFARGTASDGSAVVAVNANCLDGVDTRALAAGARQVDGASF